MLRWIFSHGIELLSRTTPPEVTLLGPRFMLAYVPLPCSCSAFFGCVMKLLRDHARCAHSCFAVFHSPAVVFLLQVYNHDSAVTLNGVSMEHVVRAHDRCMPFRGARGVTRQEGGGNVVIARRPGAHNRLQFCAGNSPLTLCTLRCAPRTPCTSAAARCEQSCCRRRRTFFWS